MQQLQLQQILTLLQTLPSLELLPIKHWQQQLLSRAYNEVAWRGSFGEVLLLLRGVADSGWWVPRGWVEEMCELVMGSVEQQQQEQQQQEQKQGTQQQQQEPRQQEQLQQQQEPQQQQQQEARQQEYEQQQQEPQQQQQQQQQREARQQQQRVEENQKDQELAQQWWQQERFVGLGSKSSDTSTAPAAASSGHGGDGSSEGLTLKLLVGLMKAWVDLGVKRNSDWMAHLIQEGLR